MKSQYKAFDRVFSGEQIGEYKPVFSMSGAHFSYVKVSRYVYMQVYINSGWWLDY